MGARRRELGIDQREASALIGMSRTTYSSYERDVQRPSADVFPAIASFLAVSMDELLALYGTTCIAAIRSSLDRVLAEQPHDTGESPALIASVNHVPAVFGSPAPSVEGPSEEPDYRELPAMDLADIPVATRSVMSDNGVAPSSTTTSTRRAHMSDSDVQVALMCYPELQALGVSHKSSKSKKKSGKNKHRKR